MASMYEYDVIEDNGGGLGLYVFDSTNNCIYAHRDYERSVGQLTTDIQALDAGYDPLSFDGNHVDEDDFTLPHQSEDGWDTVAHADAGGVHTLFPDRMGNAAKLEFAPALKDHKETEMAGFITT